MHEHSKRIEAFRKKLDDYAFSLLASKEEGFPNTVAEYMSAALKKYACMNELSPRCKSDNPELIMLHQTKIRWSFFYCGLLACASVVHWLMFPCDVTVEHRNVYHMISGIQGFLSGLTILSCLHFLPGVFHLKPPRMVFWVIGIVTPAGISLSAWFRFAVRDEIMLAVSMIFWIILVLALLIFCYPLIASRKHISGKLDLFWLACALFFGAGGTFLVSSYSTIQVVLTKEIHSILFFGRGFLLQGMFVAGFIAIAPLAVKKPTSDADVRPEIGVKLLSLLLFLTSFPSEFWVNDRLGYGLRAASILFVYGNKHVLREFPKELTALQRIIWLSAWMIPIGYVIPVINPALREAGLHTVFIAGFTGGFLSMALNAFQKKLGRPIHPFVFKAFFVTILASTLLRFVAESLSTNQILWLSLSATVFTLGIVLWMMAIFSAVLPQKC